MSAFESSPVHCEKSRPSGKRRNPGKAGTAEILQKGFESERIKYLDRAGVIPVVNISNNLLPTRLSMQFLQILVHPHYDVVFEGSFYYLMEKVGRQ